MEPRETEGAASAKRAVLYLRVSSVDQQPETQLLDLRRLAAQRGYNIVAEFATGAIAELERNLIIERVGDRMRRAKLEGRHIGRRRLELDRDAIQLRIVVLTALADLVELPAAQPLERMNGSFYPPRARDAPSL